MESNIDRDDLLIISVQLLFIDFHSISQTKWKTQIENFNF